MRLKIKKQDSIRKRVYRYIKEKILNDEIPSGERLIEGKIAKEIGVSRTPVREALHALEHEGLLEALPKSGYIVKPIEKGEVEEICEIRKVIERLALSWAIKKNRDKLLKELKKNIEICEEKLKEGNIKAFIELDARFHEIIAKKSGSERLLELSKNLRRHMLRYRIQSIYADENVKRAIEGHKKIVSAVEEGKEENIMKALEKHIEQSKKDILKYAF